MSSRDNEEVKISPHDPQTDEAMLLVISGILDRTDISARQKEKLIAALLCVDLQAQSKEDEARKLAWLVWQKTDGRCTYCNEQLNPFDRNAWNGYHIDHVVPRAAGGTDDTGNLVPACARCNLNKSARTPEEWRVIRG